MQRRALLVGLAALLASCRRKSGTRIAVIPKGTTHEFWKSVHAGAVKASRELSVSIEWKGPLKEDDLPSQIDLVDSFVARGISGIVLAPLNDKGLVAPVKRAVQSKIPVVIFDSALAGEDHASFVATDNVAAGKLGGQKLAKLLGGKGRVVLLRYLEGSASTADRERGFLEAMKENPGITVVSDNQYGGATTESAFAASENVLAAQKAGEGQVQGIFCPNESTTFGMLLALEKLGKKDADKPRFVGFDSSEKLVAALKGGTLDGLVLQNPMRMGELAVKTMASHLKGESIEKRIDTGAVVVDKANMDAPESKALLSPDLRPWLGE